MPQAFLDGLGRITDDPPLLKRAVCQQLLDLWKVGGLVGGLIAAEQLIRRHIQAVGDSGQSIQTDFFSTALYVADIRRR